MGSKNEGIRPPSASDSTHKLNGMGGAQAETMDGNANLFWNTSQTSTETVVNLGTPDAVKITHEVNHDKSTSCKRGAQRLKI